MNCGEKAGNQIQKAGVESGNQARKPLWGGWGHNSHFGRGAARVSRYRAGSCRHSVCRVQAGL